MAGSGQGAGGEKLIVMGIITSAHGIRGEVKLKSFAQTPQDIAAYGPLLVNGGPREVVITRLRPAKGCFIARLEGIDDRNAAEELRGARLMLPRARLPEPEEDDTFYYEDLVGLKAQRADGSPAGEVVAVHDFGAGDLLEIRPEGARGTYYLPFTKQMVPEVDIAGGRIVIAPPAELEEPALKASSQGRHKRRRARKQAAGAQRRRAGGAADDASSTSPDAEDA